MNPWNIKKCLPWAYNLLSVQPLTEYILTANISASDTFSWCPLQLVASVEGIYCKKLLASHSIVLSDRVEVKHQSECRCLVQAANVNSTICKLSSLLLSWADLSPFLWTSIYCSIRQCWLNVLWGTWNGLISLWHAEIFTRVACTQRSLEDGLRIHQIQVQDRAPLVEPPGGLLPPVWSDYSLEWNWKFPVVMRIQTRSLFTVTKQ